MYAGCSTWVCPLFFLFSSHSFTPISISPQPLTHFYYCHRSLSLSPSRCVCVYEQSYIESVWLADTEEKWGRECTMRLEEREAITGNKIETQIGQGGEWQVPGLWDFLQKQATWHEKEVVKVMKTCVFSTLSCKTSTNIKITKEWLTFYGIVGAEIGDEQILILILKCWGFLNKHMFIGSICLSLLLIKRLLVQKTPAHRIAAQSRKNDWRSMRHWALRNENHRMTHPDLSLEKDKKPPAFRIY